MKQNDATFTINTVARLLVKTTFCFNGSTESKIFFRKKSLKKYLEKIFQEGSVEAQIEAEEKFFDKDKKQDPNF